MATFKFRPTEYQSNVQAEIATSATFKPSVLALIIQISALLCVSMIGLFIKGFLPENWVNQYGFYSILAAQALCSALFASVWGMALWWRVIHFVFPLAVGVMTQVELNNNIYLIGFIVTLTLYWSVHKTQVPFYPSFPATWQAVNKLINKHSKDRASLRIIDIGSGLGDFPMFMANQRPKDQVLGIEIAPLPWFISKVRAALKNNRADFLWDDYREHSFLQFDVVFAYMSPAAMTELWQKARTEMRPGTLLISSEFPVPNVKPYQTLKPSKFTPMLYIYKFQ